MSEALSAGRVEEAARIAAGFAPYRSLFGEDLTAVRDELAALTASAAGEAHRLNRGLTILEIVMLGPSVLGISVSMTTVFHRRIKLLRGKTLPTDWDGVWQLTDK